MKHLIMGTAGHVDHGKTSLIKALTNIDCDTHKEEKERGITINLGFSHIDLPSGNSLGIIDVPGHKDFINTMVGGASGIDFVLLVIAADSGIMPQTKEHLDIIRTLKVKKAIVALNKIDLVDEELVDLAKLEIMEWLDTTEFKDTPIVGVSSKTKVGLDELIAEMDKIIPQIEEKESGNFFRMYVDRIFTVKGIGSVVTGSVLNGEISMGKDLFLLPGNKQKLRIRGIQRHGKEVDSVVMGDRAAFNLTGLKSEDFKRGMLLTDKLLETTQMIDAHVSLFENIAEIKLWSTVVFYSGTFESQAKMHLLNKDSIKNGEDAIVQIHLEKEAVLMHKDKFVIRNTSGNQSLGGGVIIDANPLHHRKRTEKLISELELLVLGILNENNIGELIKIELKKVNKAFSIKELADALNQDKSEIIEEVKAISEVFFYTKDEVGILVLASVEDTYRKEILENIKDYHTKNPILENGLTENDLYGKLGLSKDKAGKLYLGMLLEKMNSENEITSYKNTWRAVDFKVDLDEKIKTEIQWVEEEILGFDTQKPVFSELKETAAEKKIPIDKLKLYISYLTEKKKLTYLDGDFIHTDVVTKYRIALLNKLKSSPEGFFYGELREETGLTKKLIPILLRIYSNEGLLLISEPKENKIRVKITEKGERFLS